MVNFIGMYATSTLKLETVEQTPDGLFFTMRCLCRRRTRMCLARFLEKPLYCSRGCPIKAVDKLWRVERTTLRSAKQRCLNPASANYPAYGGRGITVCEEWQKSFDAFLEHVGPKPRPDMSLDRINNDGHYEPDNVRWATDKEQQNNRRNSKKYRESVQPVE